MINESMVMAITVGIISKNLRIMYRITASFR